MTRKIGRESGRLTSLSRNFVFIEVCGTEKFDYEYRDRIYRKNGFLVVFIHFYKEKEKWKAHLIRIIMEIEEQRHSEVMKMINALI